MHPNTSTPIEQRVDIGGFALHVQLAGRGAPCVIFENGMGGFLQQWFAIQPAIAQRTRTLSYDRAGQGLSDLAPTPRWPSHYAAELRELLRRLQIEPPYILVAHSLGGLISRCFARTYAAGVAGLVLVDASHERQMEIIPDGLARYKRVSRALGVMQRLAVIPMIGRWLAASSCQPFRSAMPTEMWQQSVSTVGRPHYYAGLRAEAREVEHYFGPNHTIPTDLGDVPLTVVTAAESILHGRPIGGFSPAELNQTHLSNQTALTAMSRQGRQVLVPSATHLSLLSNPEHARAVVGAIEAQLRALQ